MSAFSALFQAVRGRRHDHPPSHPDAGERRSIRPAAALPAPVEAAADGCEMRFNRMMAAFNLNRRELERDYPKVLLDAQTTCVWCRSKRRCFRELEAGTAARNAEHFCPNADILMVFANDPAQTAAD
jgi:hypothetical protein